MCAGHYFLSLPAGSFLGPGGNGTCLKYAAVFQGEARRSPTFCLSAARSLTLHHACAGCPHLPRLQLLLLRFRNSPGSFRHPSLPCSLGRLGAHCLICFCLPGTTVSLLSDVRCLKKHCFKCFVWLFGGFGWEPVPVIPSWLEAESLICIFLPRGTFPILNSVENSTVWMMLTLNVLIT